MVRVRDLEIQNKAIKKLIAQLSSCYSCIVVEDDLGCGIMAFGWFHYVASWVTVYATFVTHTKTQKVVHYFVVVLQTTRAAEPVARDVGNLCVCKCTLGGTCGNQFVLWTHTHDTIAMKLLAEILASALVQSMVVVSHGNEWYCFN